MGETSTKPPVPFKRILGDDYDDGQTVFTIQGTITGLYEAKKGTGSGGEWEFQNGKMKDAEGTEIEVSFSKNTQPMTAKGKMVTIRSVKTDQHGWNGIKVEDQSFTPKGKDTAVTKRVLKITGTAEIVYEGGSAPAKGSSQPENKPSGGSAGQQSTGGKWQGGSAPYMPWDIHPEVGLSDITSLHGKVRTLVDQMYPIGKKEGEVTPEFHQAAISTIFIEACKQGLQVNFAERYNKPVPPKIMPPPADPKDWKTCMIPKGANAGKTLADINEEDMTKYYDFYLDKETAFAKCVKFAFEELGYLKKRQDAEAAAAAAQEKQQGEDKALDAQEEDDIPF